MANYFIGGVGRVQAFVNTEDGLKHYFDAKTLTDSAISISTSSEEIRGGEGAQLLGKFFHTSVFNLNMTDALFDLKYLAAQIGAEIENGAVGRHMHTESLKVANGKATLSKTAIAVVDGDLFGDVDGTGIIAWMKDGDGEYTTLKVDDSNAVSVGTEWNDKEICVTYPIAKDGRQVVVNAMYYPKEFIVHLTTKLFAGDACTPSTGTYVGEIVIEIPRFQLDGSVDLGLNMSSAATFTLNGSAYANSCGCDDKPWYAKITEVMLDDEQKYAGYNGIAVLNSGELKVGDVIYVYAIADGKMPKKFGGEFKATYQGGSGETNAMDANHKITAPEGSTITVTVLEGNGDISGKTATIDVQA